MSFIGDLFGIGATPPAPVSVADESPIGGDADSDEKRKKIARQQLISTSPRGAKLQAGQVGGRGTLLGN